MRLWRHVETRQHPTAPAWLGSGMQLRSNLLFSCLVLVWKLRVFLLPLWNEASVPREASLLLFVFNFLTFLHSVAPFSLVLKGFTSDYLPGAAEERRSVAPATLNLVLNVFCLPNMTRFFSFCLFSRKIIWETSKRCTCIYKRGRVRVSGRSRTECLR